MKSELVSPTPNRIAGFDSLRCFMIVCVIMLHAAMTYMAFAPQYWYVVDAERSIVFTGLVILLDSFPMTLLFFLAGYFVPRSLEKRGAAGFVAGKLRRLALPWAVGVIAIAPVLAMSSRHAFHLPPKPFLAFLREDFLGPWYQQGPYWFLGVLLFFMMAYLPFHRPFRRLLAGSGPLPASLLLAAVFCDTALAHFLSTTFFKPVDDWLNIGYILYFQPARILGYASVFLLGIVAEGDGWFREGWRPSLTLWGALGTIGGAAVIGVKLAVLPALAPEGGMLASACDALSYALASLGITVFLTGLFASPHCRLIGPLARFARQSFGIYWLHMPVLMPALYVLIGVPLPIAVKFVAGCLFTAILCDWLTRRFLGWFLSD